METSTGLTLLSIFKDPLMKLSKGFKDEFLHIFDNGLPEYIDNFYDKFSKTKTFIYREEKVDFYDIFFPVNIKNRNENFDTNSDLKKILNKYNFITLIGSAGSGKSMLMKHIFLSTVNQSYRIPIIIELRNLTDYQGKIYDYVTGILTKNELANSGKLVHRILKEGNFIFLLDGYDEIYSSAKDRITLDIEEFVDTYNKNKFVVTSRPGSNAESLQRFDNFYVQSLNNKQIESFIKLQFNNYEDLESVDTILSIVKKPENKDYKEYLSNPLLLSMFIFTFNTYPELPKYKSKFYSNVFDTLCTKHDAFTKKGFWLHERKSGLKNDDFENILKWFSYVTIFKGKYSFDEEFLKERLKEILEKVKLNVDLENLIYDLTVSISIMIQDGTDYTFPHKSLQEYFTAILIKSLNEEQKSKVYGEKFLQQRNHTNGGNLNLYKLCYENDKIYFSKYFLIPNTEEFIKRVDSTNPDDLTFNLLKEFGVRFISNSKMNTVGGYTEKNLIYDSYLAFFQLKSIIPSFEELNSCVSILKLSFQEMVEKNNEKYIHFDQGSEKAQIEKARYLNECGIVGKSLILMKELKNGLEKVKKDIAEENENTQDLLDI